MHNGKDTKRAMKQIKQYVQALKEGTPSLKYGFPKGNRVLFVFEFPSIMKATMKRFIEDETINENYYKFFLFVSLEDVKEHFNSWVKATGEVVKL